MLLRGCAFSLPLHCAWRLVQVGVTEWRYGGCLSLAVAEWEVTLWQGCAIGTIYVILRLVASKNEISKDVMK